ncbi:MAG: nucleotidyltransferase family protein [Ruegeria sp.]
MTEIPIILLAAGKSTRMGSADKLLQQVGNIPLLRKSAETARAVGQVLIALPPSPHPRYKVLAGLDAKLLEIPDADEGMNASLRGALAHVPSSADAVMVLLADLPNLTTADLLSVIQSVDDHPEDLVWRGVSNDGKPGHPVIFDRKLFPELLRLTGDSGAQSVVRRHADHVHLHPLPGQNAVLDLDTPEDWENWQANSKLKK